MRHRAIAAGLALLVVGAGCAEAPTARSTQPSGPVPDATLVVALQDELAGLDISARRARLVELARDEEGVTTFYTSMTVDDSSALADAFFDAYGIRVEIFRANSGRVLQRLLQEFDADFAAADVVALGGLEMEVLHDEGILAPLTTPAAADIIEGAVFPSWIGVYVQTFVAAWNTDRLDGGAVPETWEEVLTNYPTGLAMELEDFDWFAALVQDYFVAELGYTEEEAIDLFRQAAATATIVDGHTLMSELLAAGEFDLVASAYQYRVARIDESGAPVDWEPAIEPLVFRPNGVGVHVDADTPASTLLFVDFLLTEGQSIIADLGRTPASTRLPDGLPEGYDLLPVDVPALHADRAKWEALYASIVESSSGTVVSD